MNNKRLLVVSLFLSAYLHLYYSGFVLGMGSEFCNGCHVYYMLAIIFCLNIIVLFKQNILFFPIFVKIIFFTIFLIIYFFTEQLLITLSMYSIGNSGGWIRNNIYEDIHYIFQWYEVLFWNFIFSLHYPIYIYIFFKPFVNHLAKSIKKIQLDKNTTTTTNNHNQATQNPSVFNLQDNNKEFKGLDKENGDNSKYDKLYYQNKIFSTNTAQSEWMNSTGRGIDNVSKAIDGGANGVNRLMSVERPNDTMFNMLRYKVLQKSSTNKILDIQPSLSELKD